MSISGGIGAFKNGSSVLGNLGSTAFNGLAGSAAQGWAGLQGTGENGAAISTMVAGAGQSIALLRAEGSTAKAIGYQQLQTSLDVAFAKAMKQAGDDLKSLFG
jgi:hypothetical protein